MQTCPHCGCNIFDTKTERESVSFIAATRLVTYRGVTVRLTPLQLDIFEILLDAYPHAVNATTLEDAVESAARCGSGPLDERMRVSLSQMRSRFRKSGIALSIKSARQVHPLRYVLVIGDDAGDRGAATWGSEAVRALA